MTNQLQGEILFAGWEGGSPGEGGWAHTPWMPVRGDFATFAVEVRNISSATLTWEVQTRTAEDPAVSTIAGSGGTLQISSVTTQAAQNSTACKELVRYRFQTGNSPSTLNFVHFRALQPSWQFDRDRRVK